MFHFNSEELNRNYSESLKNTVILRDIVGRHKIKDLQLLEDLFKFLAVNIGNLLLIKDNHEKFVVSLDDLEFSNYEGIKHLHPWELK